MTQHAISRFAQGSNADFLFLKTQIDRSAREGRSYAFTNCLLLPECVPVSATVGFAADERGGYQLYVNPNVVYRGRNTAALRLFLAGRLNFPTFDALRDFIRSMDGQAATPAPAAAPVSPSCFRANTLTDPEKIRLPQKKADRPAPSYDALADTLGRVVLGQEAAVEAVAFSLFAHISKKSPARPLSLIFHGPTGVGKSELGKHVAPVLNHYYGENTWQFIWTELNTFTEPHSVYRLTGAPPGYVGYDDKPIFEAVCHNARTVFMFDELEKAHPEVLKTFMSVLDEGRCAARKELASKSRELDFRQCVFLFTTNAPLSSARQKLRLGFAPSIEPSAPPAFLLADTHEPTVTLADRIFRDNERARRLLSESGCLKEIAGRFGGFIEFTPLDDHAKIRVIAKQIAALGEEYGLHLTYVSPEIVQTIVDSTGAEEVFSVRSHTGVIEGYLTSFFAEQAGNFGDSAVRLEGTMANKHFASEPVRARA